MKRTRFLTIFKHFSYRCIPFYISGISGSGTSLITGLMDQHFINSCTINESTLAFDDNKLLKAQSVKELGGFYEFEKQVFRYIDVNKKKQIRKECVELYKKVAKTEHVKNVFDKSSNYHLINAELMKRAFPNSKFVIIFRNPLENIEGLQRKWNEFKCTNIKHLSRYWINCYNRFIKFEESSLNKNDFIYIDYDKLIGHPNQVINEIQSLYKFEKRDNKKYYENKENNPGKGLRNVFNGEIIISNKYKELFKENLSARDIKDIKEITFSTYKKLKNKAFMGNK